VAVALFGLESGALLSALRFASEEGGPLYFAVVCRAALKKEGKQEGKKERKQESRKAIAETEVQFTSGAVCQIATGRV
jgi:hypothetical protein